MNKYIVLILFVLFALGLAYYVGHRLIGKRGTDWTRFIAWSALLGSALSLPAMLAFRPYMLTHGSSLLAQIIWYAIGLFTILLMFTVLRDVLILLMNVVESLVAHWQKKNGNLQTYATYQKQLGRREFLARATHIGALVCTTGVFGRAAMDANDMQPTVVSTEIPIANLPAGLEGLRIVQISDLHVGQIHHDQSLIASIVRTVQSLNADVIALTGDMTDGMVSQLSSKLAPLAQLKGKHGQYFVTGNHEYYSDKVEHWITRWHELGFTCLSNQHQVLNINGEKLVVAGVHDLRSGKRHTSHVCSPQKALQGAPEATTVMLAHHPDTAKLNDGLRVDLQLSGHTHGGQYFPGTWIVRLVHQFKTGLNRYRNSWVYVNSGTGYWGPALRSTDVVSEISLLTLKRG